MRQGDKQLSRAKLVALTAAAIAPLLLVGCGGGGGTARGQRQRGWRKQVGPAGGALHLAEQFEQGPDGSGQPRPEDRLECGHPGRRHRDAGCERQGAGGREERLPNPGHHRRARRVTPGRRGEGRPSGHSPQQTLEQVEPVLKSTKTQFQASYNGLACSSTASPAARRARSRPARGACPARRCRGLRSRRRRPSRR